MKYKRPRFKTFFFRIPVTLVTQDGVTRPETLEISFADENRDEALKSLGEAISKVAQEISYSHFSKSTPFIPKPFKSDD